MVIEPLTATDAGGKYGLHRAYEMPLALLPVAWLLKAQREYERERSIDPTRTRQFGVGGG
jgi:hypothetical protein